MMVYALCVLVPINSQGSNNLHGFDRLSASNVGTRSNMMWAHFVGAYLFSFGLLYFLYKEYQKVHNQTKSPTNEVSSPMLCVRPHRSTPRHINVTN